MSSTAWGKWLCTENQGGCPQSINHRAPKLGFCSQLQSILSFLYQTQDEGLYIKCCVLAIKEFACISNHLSQADCTLVALHSFSQFWLGTFLSFYALGSKQARSLDSKVLSGKLLPTHHHTHFKDISMELLLLAVGAWPALSCLHSSYQYLCCLHFSLFGYEGSLPLASVDFSGWFFNILVVFRFCPGRVSG